MRYDEMLIGVTVSEDVSALSQLPDTAMGDCRVARYKIGDEIDVATYNAHNVPETLNLTSQATKPYTQGISAIVIVVFLQHKPMWNYDHLPYTVQVLR